MFINILSIHLQQSLNNVEQELSSVKTELQRVNGMINVKETQIQEQDRQLQMAQMKVGYLFQRCIYLQSTTPHSLCLSGLCHTARVK